MLGICPDPGAHQRSLLASVPGLQLIRDHSWHLSGYWSSSEITFGFCTDPEAQQRSVLILELIRDHSGPPLNPFCCNSIRKHSFSKLYSPLACHLFPLISDWWTLLGTVPIPSAKEDDVWSVLLAASQFLGMEGQCTVSWPTLQKENLWFGRRGRRTPLHYLDTGEKVSSLQHNFRVVKKLLRIS